MILIPAVPLKLRITPPLMDPIRSAALTRLVREGSTRGFAFFLPAQERQYPGSSRGSHHPPRLFTPIPVTLSFKAFMGSLRFSPLLVNSPGAKNLYLRCFRAFPR